MRVARGLCVAAVVWAVGCVPGELGAGSGGASTGGAGTTGEGAAGGSGGSGGATGGAGGASTGGSGGSGGASTGGSGGSGGAGCSSDVQCPAGSDCVGYACEAGVCVPHAKDEGMPCGPQSGNPCASLVCISGACSLQTLADGTALPDADPGDCLVPECQDAQPVDVPHDRLCTDQSPFDCVVPSCSESSGACLAAFAPSGTPCKKNNGSQGTCTVNGSCQ